MALSFHFMKKFFKRWNAMKLGCIQIEGTSEKAAVLKQSHNVLIKRWRTSTNIVTLIMIICTSQQYIIRVNETQWNLDCWNLRDRQKVSVIEEEFGRYLNKTDVKKVQILGNVLSLEKKKSEIFVVAFLNTLTFLFFKMYICSVHQYNFI